MQVCRESCQHAPYQRVFTRGTEPRWTWVNFELDIFYITSVYETRCIVSHRSKVQRLEICPDADDYDLSESITRLGASRDLDEFIGLKELRIIVKRDHWIWGTLFAPSEWNVFELCPWAKVTFIQQGSQLILTGPQLHMVDDWLEAFAFDCKNNMLDENHFAYTLQSTHFSLAQMYEID